MVEVIDVMIDDQDERWAMSATPIARRAVGVDPERLACTRVALRFKGGLHLALGSGGSLARSGTGRWREKPHRVLEMLIVHQIMQMSNRRYPVHHCGGTTLDP